MKKRNYKLFSVKNGKNGVNSMKQAEELGLLYGIDKYHYMDDTNKALFVKKKDHAYTRSEKIRVNAIYLRFDRYNQYYEKLGELLSSLGCERAALKCYFKALVLEHNVARDKNFFCSDNYIPEDILLEKVTSLYYQFIEADEYKFAHILMLYHFKWVKCVYDNIIKSRNNDINAIKVENFIHALLENCEYPDQDHFFVEYDLKSSCAKDDLTIFIGKNNHYGVNNGYGDIVLEPIYDNISINLKENHFEVVKNGFFGKVDFLGNEYKF